MVWRPCASQHAKLLGLGKVKKPSASALTAVIEMRLLKRTWPTSMVHIARAEGQVQYSLDNPGGVVHVHSHPSICVCQSFLGRLCTQVSEAWSWSVHRAHLLP